MNYARALEAERDALRAVVRTLTTMQDGEHCAFCDAEHPREAHLPDCPVLRGQQLVAADDVTGP